MVDVQTISIVVAAAGVFIAAMNSIISSRRAEEQRQLKLETQQHALETRQAQLFMQVYSQWSSPEFVNAYRMVRYLYTFSNIDDLVRDIEASASGKIDPNLYLSCQTLNTYFEEMGMLVKRNLVNVDLVEDLLAERLIWYWETYAITIAERTRKRQNDPSLFDDMEDLYHEMKHRQRLTARPQAN